MTRFAAFERLESRIVPVGFAESIIWIKEGWWGTPQEDYQHALGPPDGKDFAIGYGGAVEIRFETFYATYAPISTGDHNFWPGGVNRSEIELLQTEGADDEIVSVRVHLIVPGLPDGFWINGGIWRVDSQSKFHMETGVNSFISMKDISEYFHEEFGVSREVPLLVDAIRLTDVRDQQVDSLGGFDFDAVRVWGTVDRVTGETSSMPTRPGDVDFDGDFDSQDLVQVLQSNCGSYGNGRKIPDSCSLWQSGDWNQDRYFDAADLVLALQYGYSN